jgi:hypothetical protein
MWSNYNRTWFSGPDKQEILNSIQFNSTLLIQKEMCLYNLHTQIILILPLLCAGAISLRVSSRAGIQGAERHVLQCIETRV